MRPGYKTSEMYAAHGASGGLFAVVLSEPNVWVKCAALIAIGIVQAAYVLSRGLEKSVAALEDQA